MTTLFERIKQINTAKSTETAAPIVRRKAETGAKKPTRQEDKPSARKTPTKKTGVKKPGRTKPLAKRAAQNQKNVENKVSTRGLGKLKRFMKENEIDLRTLKILVKQLGPKREAK